MIFFTSGPADRFLSAATAAGQGVIMLLLIIWISNGKDHSMGRLGVVLMSLAFAWRMRRDGRAVRAEEEAAKAGPS